MRLCLRQRVALLDQPVELLGLFRDPVSVARFIPGTRERRSLFDQLPDIVAHDGDALVELGARERAAVTHRTSRDDGVPTRWQVRQSSAMPCRKTPPSRSAFDQTRPRLK